MWAEENLISFNIHTTLIQILNEWSNRMENDRDKFNDFFDELEEMDFLHSGSYWIEKAVEQKNPMLTLDLACSKLLLYDQLDKKILNLSRLN
jgi:hypothetical protein